MILGIGTDIIEIERIENVIKRYGKKFLDRIFTSEEQKYCQKFHSPYARYAARFAAKEAISKALGTGFQGIGWLDIEILNEESGKPIVKFSSHLSSKFNNPKIELSISHSESNAIAFAVWCK